MSALLGDTTGKEGWGGGGYLISTTKSIRADATPAITDAAVER